MPRDFRRRPLAMIATALAAAPFLAGPGASQNPASGPVARYDMRAGTVSGFMAMRGMGASAGREEKPKCKKGLGGLLGGALGSC
jgi:hypothetical protein